MAASETAFKKTQNNKKPNPLYKLSQLIFMNAEILVNFFLSLNIVLLAVPVVPVVLYTTTKESHCGESKLPSLNFHLHMKVWQERDRKRLGNVLYIAIF